MREALTRLREAEEANEQQLRALKKELQSEEAQQQQALQERSAALEEALAQEQATIEEQLQQSQIVEGVIGTYGSNQTK